MDAKERINAILEREGISASQLAETIGSKRAQAIYDILNGKTKSISKTMASKINAAKPYYKLEWLMTGEGDMLETNAPTPTNEKSLVMELLDRIDKLIEIHEQDTKNLERLLSIMMDKGYFEKTAI